MFCAYSTRSLTDRTRVGYRDLEIAKLHFAWRKLRLACNKDGMDVDHGVSAPSGVIDRRVREPTSHERDILLQSEYAKMVAE